MGGQGWKDDRMNEALPVFFLGAGLMALGFLAALVGFFKAMMSGQQAFERSSMIFVLGIVALVVGAWLMRLAP